MRDIFRERRSCCCSRHGKKRSNVCIRCGICPAIELEFCHDSVSVEGILLLQQSVILQEILALEQKLENQESVGFKRDLYLTHWFHSTGIVGLGTAIARRKSTR